MTLARIQATGRGRLRARAVIEGFPDEIVSAADMVRARGTTTTGRIIGLDLKSIRFGARGDLMRARIEAESCSIAAKGAAAGVLLGKRPSEVVYLTSTLAVADTTANVTDTSKFAASGVIHVGTEAISYSGKTGTSFTGLTRGIWGTTAQAHYASDGTGLSYPRVTEVPESLEGRRVLIYFYGDGDDPAGDGTLVHRGIAATGIRQARGVWSFTLDPITRILDGKLGAKLAEPARIRGIYYPSTAPFVLVLTNVTSGGVALVKLVGFFADEQAFCDELTLQIADAIGDPTGTWTWGTGASIVAEPVGPGEITGGGVTGTLDSGWQLTYNPGTAGTPAAIDLTGSISYVDGFTEATPWRWYFDDTAGGTSGVPEMLQPGTAPALSTPYYLVRRSGFPRAAVGRGPVPPEYQGYNRWASEPASGTADSHFIYYDSALVPPSDATALIYSGDPSDDAPHSTTTLLGVNTTDRYLDCLCMYQRLNKNTRIKLGTGIAQGTVEDFRAALVANSPSLCGLGAMPLVTAADILTLDLAELLAAGSIPLASNRIFVGLPDITIGEVVENELLALGCYQRLNAGALEWARLHSGLSTDAATWTILESDIGRDWPEFGRGEDGIVSTVTYRTGWDPLDGDHKGASITVHDVEAASSNRTAIDVEIAQRSFPAGRTEGAADPGVTIDAVSAVALPLASLFGTEYDRIRVTVGMRFFGAKFGDVVALTSSKVPALDGTFGVAGDLCTVVGHSFDASTHRVSLELHRSGQNVAGYAPSFLVTGQSNVGGNVWDVTVALSPYTDATDVATILRVGDAMRVRQSDATAPTEVLGSVTSFTSATVVRVTFVGAWVPGASEWCLVPQDAGAHQSGSGIGLYFFIAGSNLRVTYADTTKTARVLGA